MDALGWYHNFRIYFLKAGDFFWRRFAYEWNLVISNDGGLIRYVESGVLNVLLHFSVKFWRVPDVVGDDGAV